MAKVKNANRKNVKFKKETVIYANPQHKQKGAFFPKIFRFITEYWKFLVSGVISLVILTIIIFQSISLYQNFQEEKRLIAERENTEKELKFWRESLAMYKDSRDIYFRIASLEYALGNKDKAREDLQKALEIDPNFKDGREMEKRLGL